MRSGDESAPGRGLVVVWALAALIAIPSALWAQAEVRAIEVPSSHAFHDYNAERVATFRAEVDGGALGVVMFGDSRLRYGAATQEELSVALTEAAGRDVAVLKLVNDWAVLSDFESLLPTVLAAEPDLVLLQDELRGRNRGRDAQELLQREYLWWKLLGRNAWDPGDRSQQELQEDTSCAVDESIEARATRLSQWIDFAPDGPATSQLASLVDQLDRDGVEYRFLGLPITEAAQAGLPGITPSEGSRALAPAMTFDDALFCDLVHLGADGRALYTDWLVGALASELVPEPRIT